MCSTTVRLVVSPPERGYIFNRVSGHDERVAISLVEVYERVEKSVIWVCKITESD